MSQCLATAHETVGAIEHSLGDVLSQLPGTLKDRELSELQKLDHVRQLLRELSIICETLGAGSRKTREQPLKALTLEAARNIVFEKTRSDNSAPVGEVDLF